MALEKQERNKEFIRCWKTLGMGNKELAEKFGLSPGGVKGLKGRLRKKHQELYIDEQEIKRQVDKSSNRQIEEKRKACYYLSVGLAQKIKIEAVKRNVSASELVEDSLSRVLSNERI
ncbi:MAG: hypothetical protein GH145_02725 [Firmicutes bacterium]|jgi:uncharacterized protein YjcR|nr:hypothetical protein [Bacillota bacterium]